MVRPMQHTWARADITQIGISPSERGGRLEEFSKNDRFDFGRVRFSRLCRPGRINRRGRFPGLPVRRLLCPDHRHPTGAGHDPVLRHGQRSLHSGQKGNLVRPGQIGNE